MEKKEEVGLIELQQVDRSRAQTQTEEEEAKIQQEQRKPISLSAFEKNAKTNPLPVMDYKTFLKFPDHRQRVQRKTQVFTKRDSLLRSLFE